MYYIYIYIAWSILYVWIITSIDVSVHSLSSPGNSKDMDGDSINFFNEGIVMLPEVITCCWQKHIREYKNMIFVSVHVNI